jgi:hypothetical protein
MPAVPRRLERILVAVAATACLIVGAADVAPASAALPPWHGVPVTLGALTAPELVQAHTLGATAVEVYAQWNYLEPSAPGQFDAFDVNELDEAVNGAAALGMKVILRARGTPCWDTTEPPKAKALRPDLCAAYPPARAQDYGDFVSWLAQRYAGKLAAVEVWAEEDHDDGQHFAGPDRPGHYAALLKAAHAAVAASGSPVPVLIGALVGADGAFLDALYKAGIRGSYDGIAVDFYNVVLASVRSIHQIQLAHGDNTPLWLEEFGWTTCSTPRSIAEAYFACVSPQQQAQNLDDVFRALNEVTWIEGALVFTLRDNPSLHFGISSADGTPKAAFATVENDFHGGVGRPRAVTLRVGRSALAGTAPVGDEISLTVSPPRGRGGHRYSANLVLSVNGTYSWPLPRGVGRGWRVVASEPWTHGAASLTLKGR